jgi:hypothetical protein
MGVRDTWFSQDVPPGELSKLPTDLSAGYEEMIRTRDRELARLRAFVQEIEDIQTQWIAAGMDGDTAMRCVSDAWGRIRHGEGFR